MVKFLINRPIAVFMSFFALLLIGTFSAFLLPVSLLPDINIPEITVRIAYPGKPVIEMEQSVVAPIRLQLMQIPGLDELESEARDGEGTFKLKFSYGANIDFIFVEVNEKVDMAMAELPREVQRPRIIKASASDLPVFNINIGFADTTNLTSSKMLELSQLASKIIRKRIEQMPEVALADITGITTPELVIIPDQGKLGALGITPEQVTHALKQSMFGLGSIRMREGQLVFDVVIEQKIILPSDIQNVVISSGGRVFKLSDLAAIELKPARSQGAYIYNGIPSICIPVIKHTNARMSDLKKVTKDLIDQLHKDYPDLTFTISNDQTRILDYSITNLRNSLIAGIILAISAMFLFLGDYRNPILMGITIPISLIISMMFFHLAGLSVNIVSLSGLILGVGMMIDNSIVVIDNITQWRSRGIHLHNAVIGATNEVVRPLLSSMLTTCAVFIPLVFLSGISGAMFRDQAFAVSIGLGVSFWVSITLLPTLYYRLNFRNQTKWRHSSGFIPLEKSYNKGFSLVFSKRKVILLVAMILVFACPWLFLKIDKRQMPELTRTESIVNVAWGNNISLEENTERCRKLIRYIHDGIEETAFFVGRQQLLLARGMDMSESDASLYLSAENGFAINRINGQVEEWFSINYPNSSVSFTNAESVFERIFPPPDAMLIVKISGSNGNMLPPTSVLDSITSSLVKNYPNASIVTIPYQQQIFLSLDPAILSLYSISAHQVNQAIEVALQSNRVGYLSYEQQVIPITFGDEPQSLNIVLDQTSVVNADGSHIPIRAILSKETKTGFRSIFGDNSGAFIPLKINANDKVVNSILVSLKEYDLYDKTQKLSFSGEFFSSKLVFWEMVGVLMVSILLLYFILAAQFESLKQPLIVLLELPIDVAGALVIIWLLGGTVNLMTMIGLVVMGGIIVNDSILKIDTINRLRLQGLPLLDAISEGGKRRLKPIVMTSLTTILALLPILIGSDLGSELQQPLAIATIGGMIFGTLVSLYFIPLLYWFLYKNKLVLQ